MYSSLQSICVNWLSINESNSLPYGTGETDFCCNFWPHSEVMCFRSHRGICFICISSILFEKKSSVDLELCVVILLVNLISHVVSSGSPLGYCCWLCKLMSFGQKIHLYTAKLEKACCKSKWIKTKCILTNSTCKIRHWSQIIFYNTDLSFSSLFIF